jgi:hypothetical protein
LAFFLFDAEEAVVNELTARLRASSSGHYRDMETIDLRPRMQALFEAYRESVLAGDPRLIAAFTDDIGRKRLQQEYDLGELQLVLNTLSDVLWDTAAVAFEVRGGDAFSDLRKLAEGVLWAKDSLARVYADVEKSERAAFGRLSTAFNEYLKLRGADAGGRYEQDRGDRP